MFKMELLDKNEFLEDEKIFSSKTEMLIFYNRIINNLNTRHNLKNHIIELFEGQDEENLKEIRKYRIEL